MPNIRILYLGGLGRSGSTLIERLLGQLPGVCVLGEVVHLWQRGIADRELCGCGTEFGTCDFWSGVGQRAFGGWDAVNVNRLAELRQAVDRTRFIPRLARQDKSAPLSAELAEYLDYYLRVYQAAADVSGSRTIVDSSKHASLAFCLRRRSDLDLRVIQVVRDSRAVAYSWTTTVPRPDSRGESYMSTYSPARAAVQWNAENGALHLLPRGGSPVLRMRYEDVVQRPDSAVTRMAHFAELGDSPDLSFLGTDSSGHWANLRVAHTASGNPMRFSAGKIVIHADERWRTAMPAAQRRMVTALTLPLLRRYGYLGGTR